MYQKQNLKAHTMNKNFTYQEFTGNITDISTGRRKLTKLAFTAV